MEKELQPVSLQRIEHAILLIRGQRVMLDSDLAKIYGVSTMALNQALKRNLGRFPSDFAFQLTRQEFTCLISQIVISKKGRGGRRTLPWVFTEHGVIMLANILNSDIAIDAGVRVVRVFIRMRELLASNKELAQKFSELEKRLDGHDESIANLFEAIRKLLAAPATKEREIGFHIKEEAAPYRTRRFKIPA